MRGKVKFQSDKGYGFITPDDGSRDVFFHVSELARTGVDMLQEGQPVEYEVAQGKKGLEARAIKLLVA